MTTLLEQIKHSQITPLPGQVWHAIRLVPLLSSKARYDLRMYRQLNSKYDWAQVDLGGDLNYFCYSPNGMVIDWSEDGSPVVSPGTQLGQADGKYIKGLPLRQYHRMVKALPDRRVRLLSLDLAISGFLATYFNAPALLWTDFYSKKVHAKGLNPSQMRGYSGHALWGLEQALRLFELHPEQVGLILYVGDAPASVVLMPNPEDYASVHRSLLQDMFAELFLHYLYYSDLQSLKSSKHFEAKNWQELRLALQRERREIGDFQFWMGEQLLECPLRMEQVRRLGGFVLQRFLSESNASTAFTGEQILSASGELLYLKLMVLPQAQQQQLELLDLLKAYDWHPGAAAAARQWSETQLIQKLHRVGLGEMVRIDRLRQALAEKQA